MLVASYNQLLSYLASYIASYIARCMPMMNVNVMKTDY